MTIREIPLTVAQYNAATQTTRVSLSKCKCTSSRMCDYCLDTGERSWLRDNFPYGYSAMFVVELNTWDATPPLVCVPRGGAFDPDDFI